MNAQNAVKNHPPITVITPLTLKTADSRPHALSANEVPMATINVTYVVESGSYSDVAKEIKLAATVQFTEALSKSYAGISL